MAMSTAVEIVAIGRPPPVYDHVAPPFGGILAFALSFGQA